MISTINNFLKNVNESQLFLSTPNILSCYWQQQKPMYIVEDGIRKKETRFCKGQQIKVVNSQWLNCDDAEDVSHEILDVYGTCSHSFSFKLKSLITGEESSLNL